MGVRFFGIGLFLLAFLGISAVFADNNEEDPCDFYLILESDYYL